MITPKTNKKPSTPPSKAQNDVISDKQVKFLQTTVSKLGIDRNKAKEIIAEFGYQSSKEIEPKKFNDVLSKFDEVAKQMEVDLPEVLK